MLTLSDIPIDKELHNFVRKITLFKSKGHINYTQRLMPSMYTYLSFNKESIPSFCVGNKSFQSDQRIQVAGPKTRSDIYVEHKGVIEQLLFEFNACGFYRLFNTSPETYCNKLKKPERVLCNEVKDESEIKTLTIEECSDRLQDELKSLLSLAIKADLRILKSISLIMDSKGLISISDICNEVHMSTRNFSRLFKKLCGVSPQTYIKILQLHRIIGQMGGTADNQKMFDIAYLSGFFDQAHFNHSFKKLVNLSPSQFLKSKEHVSLKYFEIQ